MPPLRREGHVSYEAAPKGCQSEFKMGGRGIFDNNFLASEITWTLFMEGVVVIYYAKNDINICCNF
jgi:hypothetical protein